MAKRCAFFLMSWLLCTYVATVLAMTPPQKHVREYTPLQSKSKAVAPLKTAPQVVSGSPLNTPAQQVPTPTPTTQDDINKHRYIAEETVMQRAWIYSAILPGCGQLYNEHYWKIPVIYLGFAGLFWGAIYYHREYIQFKRAIMQNKGWYSLVNYVDECRTGRDICIIFAALWYVVNIFDAYVGASLKTFTLSDDISMGVQPTMLPTARNLPTIGLSLTFSFQNENALDRLWQDGASH